MYIGSFFTSFANFSEFDVGNMISFQIKVFDGNIKQAKLARYFIKVTARPTLRKKCPYSELFWSAFFRIWTRITPNTDTFQAVLVTRVIRRLIRIHSITMIQLCLLLI